MAMAAPTAAIQGATNKEPAKNAKTNPASEPSNVLPLLKGSRLPIKPPKIEAALSPKAKMAIAAPLTGEGKISKVNSIPNAKYNGAAANP
jgi:hypothetical protein